MKTSYLTHFAALGVFAAITGIVFNVLTVALFASSVMCLLLVIAATDYSPRTNYSRLLATVRRAERLPYAG